MKILKLDHKLSMVVFGLLVISFQACNPTSPDQEGSKDADSPKLDGQTLQLASWESSPRTRILEWVEAVTTEGSPDFIPVADRIAVFDNDGTLWSEHPLYFQLAFAIDEIKRMAPEHPEWKNNASINALLNGDMKTYLAGGEKALLETVALTHSGMSTDEFDSHVKNWMKTATHPKTGRHYNEMIFQPMLELMNTLRKYEFKTFIVSGGGVDFMRAWTEEAYGIPPYQVIGSLLGLSYVDSLETPQINKTSDLFFIDDKAGKPLGIFRNIGKRPVFAAGNSDGDYEMLEYTTTGPGLRFGLYIHHTDSIRESAYDRDTPIGRLNKGLDDADKFNWMVVDMAKDWKVIYPYELEK